MPTLRDLAGEVGVQAACRALEVAAASYYRWWHPCEKEPRPRVRPPLALSALEEQAVLDVLPHGTGSVNVVEGGLEIPSADGADSTLLAHAAAVVRLDLPETRS